MYSIICFFFNDTATTEIYTLSLHDALPIYQQDQPNHAHQDEQRLLCIFLQDQPAMRATYEQQRLRDEPLQIVARDRKSTRLNSSHANISYAVFCLKKKKTKQKKQHKQDIEK